MQLKAVDLISWLVVILASIFGAVDGVTNVSELREYFNLASQIVERELSGGIPGCPDYKLIPNRVLENGVACVKEEVAFYERVDTPTNRYPPSCSSDCHEFYQYFGAECLMNENSFLEEFGGDLQDMLAYGSVPVGLDRQFILSLYNVVLNEDYEFDQSGFDYVLENRNDLVMDALDYTADFFADKEGQDELTQSLIDTCKLQRSGVESVSGSRISSHGIRRSGMMVFVILGCLFAF